MRGSTGLFLAGVVAITAGMTGLSLAADDPAPVAPAPAVGESAEEGSEAPAVVEPAAPPAPQPDAEAGATGVETEEGAADGGSDRSRSTKRDRTGKKKGQTGDRRDRDRSKRRRVAQSVTIKDFEFRPDSVTVSPGERITWTNQDTAQHDARAEGVFETALLAKGESDSVTIDEPGTYDYICTVHPSMEGTVVVRAGGSGSNGSGNSTGSGSSSGGGSAGGSTFDSGSGNPSAGGGSNGTLPRTGQEQLPLLILGTALIVAGLLTRAWHEFWIWR